LSNPHIKGGMGRNVIVFKNGSRETYKEPEYYTEIGCDWVIVQRGTVSYHWGLFSGKRTEHWEYENLTAYNKDLIGEVRYEVEEQVGE